MLSASVWSLSNFWKGVERASIYLMMFLAVAMLVLPLVQTQEVEAVEPVTVIAIATLVVGLVTLGYMVYTSLCSACSKPVGQAHYTICYGYHYGNGAKGYYVCQADQSWLHGACRQN